MMPRILFKNDMKGRSEQGHGWPSMATSGTVKLGDGHTEVTFSSPFTSVFEISPHRECFCIRKRFESSPLHWESEAPATCLRLHDTWRPLRPSACDPHSAPITYTPVSNTPPCAIFGGRGRGGLCFLCSQMSYEAITLPSFKSLLKCPFLNDVYPTTTFLTATFFPTSRHSVSPFFPHRTYLLPKILYNLLLWYVYYFPSILPTKV